MSIQQADTPTQRLFIGFPIRLSGASEANSAGVATSVRSALKRTRINAQKKGMEVKWVLEENLHVTLNFLGSTSSTRLGDLEEILRTIGAEFAPIKTSLRGMGAFPDDRHMRAIWIGVRKSRPLATLHGRLTTLLREYQFDQEDREYIPHLTIGRLRKSRSGTDLLSPYVRTHFGDILVRSAVLYESVLHGAHPVYRPLIQVDFSGTVDTDAEAVIPESDP